MSRRFGNRQIVVPAGAEDSSDEDCGIRFESESEDDEIRVECSSRGTGSAMVDLPDEGDATEDSLFFPRRAFRARAATAHFHGWAYEGPQLPPGLAEFRQIGFGRKGNRQGIDEASAQLVTSDKEVEFLLQSIGLCGPASSKIAAKAGSIEALIETPTDEFSEGSDDKTRKRLELGLRYIRQHDWMNEQVIRSSKAVISSNRLSNGPASGNADQGTSFANGESTKPKLDLGSLWKPLGFMGFLSAGCRYLAKMAAAVDDTVDQEFTDLELEKTMVHLPKLQNASRDLRERMEKMRNGLQERSSVA